MREYSVKNIMKAPELSDVRLSGSIADQMDTYFCERVTSDFAKNVVYKETEQAFREQKDDETLVGYWRGEFWGKWVISACRVYRYTKDESLRSFLSEAAHSLISLQQVDGYIGTYKDEYNVFPADTEKTKALVGWPCNWNWNIWCRKYTLWGLLEIFGITGDKAILDSACRLASNLIGMLSSRNIKLCDTGTFGGLPSGSIMKPMLILYEHTGDKMYLDFCVEIASYWEREDGKSPNLITNALNGIPVHKWYPSSQNWAKAYEMMSCLDGLLELHRVTGVVKYLDTAKAMYGLLKENELNAMFSVGFNDIFANASKYINSCSEPCDVIHWMRLCYELFALTGEEKYMDSFEKAYLNAFLAGAFADGKWSARAVRSAGRHIVSHQPGMQYNHCCTDNMPRGFINACEAFATFSDSAVYVNMFTGYTGILDTPMGRVKLDISGTYLENGKVHIAVESQNGVRLCIRIPSWSKETAAEYDGKTFTPASTGYFELDVKEGVCFVDVHFDVRPVILDFPYEVESYPEKDFRIQRFLTGNDVTSEVLANERKSTVTYGPLLLTRSKLCGNSEKEMFGSETICGKNYGCRLESTAPDGLRVRFKAEFDNGKEKFSTFLCDYASGTNTESADDDKLFNIYL